MFRPPAELPEPFSLPSAPFPQADFPLVRASFRGIFRHRFTFQDSHNGSVVVHAATWERRTSISKSLRGIPSSIRTGISPPAVLLFSPYSFMKPRNFVNRGARRPPPPPVSENKEQAIEIEGVITAVLAGTMFRVMLANKHEVLAHISGKMRKRFIKLVIGDRVKMEMSPYDTTKARITYRL
jgi:translation initiation factor IF-1